MADDLECPGPAGSPDWSSLYRYRGAEVDEARPVFTGDVFLGVDVHGVDGLATSKNIMVVQHPCALRSNGIDLSPKLLVVEVVPSELFAASRWKGNYRVMPLPELVPGSENEHYSGLFLEACLVIPDALAADKRIACMSPSGVNLLLQRWVYHNSRAAIATSKYDDATSAQYEEADAIEDWCDIRRGKGISIEDATTEAVNWFSDDGGGGVPRRVLLENRQYRSNIRKAMRKYCKQL